MTDSLKLPPVISQKHYREIESHEVVQGKEVALRLSKDVDNLPSYDKITSASVVPFISHDKIVATILKRGIDIPGGHIEPGDAGVEQTIKREAYEEARILVAEPLYLIGIIESNFNPEQTTYMIIAAGRVSSMDAFAADFESTGREVVTIDDFMHRYVAGPYEMMDELMKRAKSLSGLLFE